MFYPSEIEILKSYPVGHDVKIADYICDFVLHNPTNYPVTCYIFKNVKTNQTTLKKIFNRENILNKISDLSFTSNLKLIKLMEAENDIGFTAFALATFMKNDNIKLIVMQQDPLIVVLYSGESPTWHVMIDQNFNDLIIYSNIDNIRNISRLFSNTVPDIKYIADTKSINGYYPGLRSISELDDVTRTKIIINMMIAYHLYNIDYENYEDEFLTTYEFHRFYYNNIYDEFLRRHEEYSKYLISANSDETKHPDTISDAGLSNSIFDIPMK